MDLAIVEVIKDYSSVTYENTDDGILVTYTLPFNGELHTVAMSVAPKDFETQEDVYDKVNKALVNKFITDVILKDVN